MFISCFGLTLFFTIFAPILAGKLELTKILAELQSEYPQESTSNLKKTLDEVTRLATSSELFSETGCLKDYSLACPMGWSDSGDGETCSAPIGYRGSCPLSMSFKGTPNDKLVLAERCGASYPCIEQCSENFNSDCPFGWSLNERTKSCTAPHSYNGPCVVDKTFSGFSSKEKSLWGKSCGVSWPCKNYQRTESLASKLCIEDYSQHCPVGWALDKGFCKAPSTYKGPCMQALASGAFSSKQKDAFSKACSVMWPCK